MLPSLDSGVPGMEGSHPNWTQGVARLEPEGIETADPVQPFDYIATEGRGTWS